jgi:hypothetical protein
MIYVDISHHANTATACRITGGVDACDGSEVAIVPTYGKVLRVSTVMQLRPSNIN